MQDDKFINSVARLLSVSRDQATKITAAVLCELRGRLTPKETADAAAQMPRELKRMWMADDSPDRKVRRIHRSEFIREISERAEIQEAEAAHAVKVVFRGLQEVFQSPTGQEREAWDIYSQLPMDLKKIWLDASRIQWK